MKLNVIAALAAFTLSAQPVLGHEFKVGDLIVDHPVAFETTPMSKSGAGYLSITNAGDVSDRLIEVRADFPHVSIHKSEEADGVMRMMPVEAIEIPAGETVTLEPGGFHVMFMGLSDPLEAGQDIPATLIFDKAGEVAVTFAIEARNAKQSDEMDHSDHDMSD
ncbi:copper chaperone PCu(A)C [Roseovarius sp. E0-M6]|uniref:copper chaperone PCu(A)C n=1 Tax=Roseovarius sp. E0-M6 TaxID=3127118 RepID=UPI0030101DD7